MRSGARRGRPTKRQSQKKQEEEKKTPVELEAVATRTRRRRAAAAAAVEEEPAVEVNDDVVAVAAVAEKKQEEEAGGAEKEVIEEKQMKEFDGGGHSIEKAIAGEEDSNGFVIPEKVNFLLPCKCYLLILSACVNCVKKKCMCKLLFELVLWFKGFHVLVTCWGKLHVVHFCW